MTSPITFVGANEVILYERGRHPSSPMSTPTGATVDLDSVAASIGPRTRALMVTHLGGNPVDLDRLYAVADRHGLAVIEDAAHACGSTYRGIRIGGEAGMQAFSFQATKNLTTIDGGMICMRSEADAARARRLRWMGIDQDTWSRGQTAGTAGPTTSPSRATSTP